MNGGDDDAVLFDLDRVLTPTAEVARRARNQLFSSYGPPSPATGLRVAELPLGPFHGRVLVTG